MYAVLMAWSSWILTHNPSSSSIARGRSSRLHLMSAWRVSPCWSINTGTTIRERHL